MEAVQSSVRLRSTSACGFDQGLTKVRPRDGRRVLARVGGRKPHCSHLQTARHRCRAPFHG
jgi:hypothetical protein